jgi:hypothetical protein
MRKIGITDSDMFPEPDLMSIKSKLLSLGLPPLNFRSETQAYRHEHMCRHKLTMIVNVNTSRIRNNYMIINVDLVNTEEESIVACISYCPDIYLKDLGKVMIFLSTNNWFTGSKSNRYLRIQSKSSKHFHARFSC